MRDPSFAYATMLIRNLSTGLLFCLICGCAANRDFHAAAERLPNPPADLAPFFRPPERYRNDFGSFRSPLIFDDGSRVKPPADWTRRRKEILSTWENITGPWPE